MRLGTPRESPGTKVTRRSITISTRKYGISFGVTSSIDTCPILHPTKSTEPTGGVIFPRHILKINITPNWMSLMPKLCAIGRKIGVKIKIAGVMSMNIPMISRITFIRMKMTYLFVDTESSALLIAAGIPE